MVGTIVVAYMDYCVTVNQIQCPIDVNLGTYGKGECIHARARGAGGIEFYGPNTFSSPEHPPTYLSNKLQGRFGL